ncbi:MAG: aspartate/glutamate racemase family protein [Bacillota bacterium]
MSREEIIGVLGGMGPDATVDLFQKIIDKTAVEKDQDHHRILIYNNPKIPDRTEAILNGGESPLKELIKTAEVLEKAGASFLVIPCNTAHYYFEELKQEVGIEILNMLEEVAKKIKRDLNIKKVGVLGTRGVLESEIYDKELKKLNFEVVKPAEEQKDKIMELIYSVKTGQKTVEMQQALSTIAESMVKKGAEAVVLGCTELPLIFDIKSFPYPVYSSQDVLAESALKRINQ